MSLPIWIQRQRAPITLAVCAGLVAASLFFFFSTGSGINALTFNVDWLEKPWTLLVYPFAFSGAGGVFALISTLLLLAWMVFTCGSVERDLGTSKFGVLLLTMTVLPALLVYGGMRLSGSGFGVMGPYFPIAGISVIWALRNPNFQLNLFGILPLTAKILAILIVAGTFFLYGFGNLILGVAAILYFTLSWAIATNRIPFFLYASAPDVKVTKAQKVREEAYLADAARRLHEREETERLRKLFERSGIDDK